MAKKLNTVPLVGVIRGKDGAKDTIAKTHQAAQVWYFGGRHGKFIFKVYFLTTGELKLISSKLEMLLVKHPSQNYYHGTSPTGTKVQVTLKKIVGELRFWA